MMAANLMVRDEPAYLLTCVAVSLVTFFLAHIPTSRYRVMLWFDAVGMALFVITLSLNIVSGLVLRRYREVYQ